MPAAHSAGTAMIQMMSMARRAAPAAWRRPGVLRMTVSAFFQSKKNRRLASEHFCELVRAAEKVGLCELLFCLLRSSATARVPRRSEDACARRGCCRRRCDEVRPARGDARRTPRLKLGHSLLRGTTSCRASRRGAVNHSPPNPLTQLPQAVTILVQHDNHARLHILSSV